MLSLLEILYGLRVNLLGIRVSRCTMHNYRYTSQKSAGVLLYIASSTAVALCSTFERSVSQGELLKILGQTDP